MDINNFFLASILFSTSSYVSSETVYLDCTIYNPGNPDNIITEQITIDLNNETVETDDQFYTKKGSTLKRHDSTSTYKVDLISENYIKYSYITAYGNGDRLLSKNRVDRRDGSYRRDIDRYFSETHGLTVWVGKCSKSQKKNTLF